MQFLSPHCSKTPCSDIVIAENKNRWLYESKKNKRKTMRISPFGCRSLTPHLNELISSCNSSVTHKSWWRFTRPIKWFPMLYTGDKNILQLKWSNREWFYFAKGWSYFLQQNYPFIYINWGKEEKSYPLSKYYVIKFWAFLTGILI